MKYSQTSGVQLETARLPGRRLLPALFCLLVLPASALSQISVQGVEDKKVYTDSVSFTVNSEPGFDYTIELNGNPVAADVSIEVDEPEYYELYVHTREQSSGLEDSLLVRFIVRASERGRSEWGLRPWVPYPSIDSASAEFAGANLEIVTPAKYPMALEIPVVARVQDDSGRRLGVFGAVNAPGFEDHPLRLLRGVGSVFLPPAAEPGVISYNAQIKSLQTPMQIEIEAATTWQQVSGDITASADWPEDARIHITSAPNDLLTIAPDATLTVGAGAVVIIDPDIDIVVEGAIVVNGTALRPVVFTAPDRTKPWGGFVFESATANASSTSAAAPA